MERVKIFFGPSSGRSLEEAINEWLKSVDIEIVRVRQSVSGVTSVVITIFYKNIE